MRLLEDLTDQQVTALAATPTPAQEGTWTLMAPDGRLWTGVNPQTCLRRELDERVPPLVALARIRRAMMEDV